MKRFVGSKVDWNLSPYDKPTAMPLRGRQGPAFREISRGWVSIARIQWGALGRHSKGMLSGGSDRFDQSINQSIDRPIDCRLHPSNPPKNGATRASDRQSTRRLANDRMGRRTWARPRPIRGRSIREGARGRRAASQRKWELASEPSVGRQHSPKQAFELAVSSSRRRHLLAARKRASRRIFKPWDRMGQRDQMDQCPQLCPNVHNTNDNGALRLALGYLMLLQRKSPRKVTAHSARERASNSLISD